MVNKVLVLLVIAAVAGAALGGLWLLPPGDADASGHSATRSFSATSVVPGEMVTVTISARDYGNLGRIVETVPGGFGGGTKTFRLLSAGPNTVSYIVTALDSPGPHTFSGTISDQERDSRAVGGLDEVTITAPATPTPTPTTPAPGTPTATRSMPASVVPGGEFKVTIRADNYGGVGRIVETLPSGFTTSDDTTFRLLSAGPSTVSYMVTASDTADTYTFSGTLQDEDKVSHMVGGRSRITVGQTTPTPTPTATRSMPASVVPGGEFTVTIRADNYGGVGRIVETLPSGFTTSDDTTFRLLSAGPSTVSYMVTASDTADTYTFSGTLQDEDKVSHMVGGRSRITVGQPTPTPTRRPSTPTPAPTPEPENRPPSFPSETATRSVAENQLAGSFIDAPVRATDPDNDVLIYGLLGPDAASFSVDAVTGQLRTKATLDYETKSTYMVTVAATDPDSDSDSIMVTIMVTNVNEMGMVELSSMTPMVGVDLTATLTDPDVVVEGSVTWQWTRSMSMDGTFENIGGETSMSYTPVAGDVGYYLRATGMYTDGHGSGKDAMETTTAAVVTTGDPLVARYDANGNGTIEKSEVIKAINDYLFGTGDGTLAPSKAEVIRLINLYLFG